MPGPIVYLEAPDRTQELLTIKWTLLSAGFRIGSTWHERKTNGWPRFRDHASPINVYQMKSCDALIVIRGSSEEGIPGLAMMAGFALARGLEVIWIGRPIGALADFNAVLHFNTVEEYRAHVLQQKVPQLPWTAEPVAA